MSTDCSRPQLSPAVIRKLTKYIGHVARPSKRMRQSTAGVMGTPRGKGRMADVDTQMLSRLLKTLDRSVKAGEDIAPFAHHPVTLSTKSSPKKPSAKKAVKGKRMTLARVRRLPGMEMKAMVMAPLAMTDHPA